MDKNKVIKIIGVVTTVAGAGLSLVSAWVGEQQTDIKIAEKVAEALAKAEGGAQ